MSAATRGARGAAREPGAEWKTKGERTISFPSVSRTGVFVAGVRGVRNSGGRTAGDGIGRASKPCSAGLAPAARLRRMYTKSAAPTSSTAAPPPPAPATSPIPPPADPSAPPLSGGGGGGGGGGGAGSTVPPSGTATARDPGTALGRPCDSRAASNAAWSLRSDARSCTQQIRINCQLGQRLGAPQRGAQLARQLKWYDGSGICGAHLCGSRARGCDAEVNFDPRCEQPPPPCCRVAYCSDLHPRCWQASDSCHSRFEGVAALGGELSFREREAD